MSFEKLKNKKTILCLMAIALISVAGYVSANDITGTVTVTQGRLNLSNLVVPANVNPTETTEIKWDMTDAAMSSLWYRYEMTFWHSSVLETDANDNATRYKVVQLASGISEAPVGFVVDYTDDAEFLGLAFYQYSMNVSFDRTALTGTWNVHIRSIEDPTNAKLSDIYGNFTMTMYSEIEIVESSFSFGSLQQGFVDMSITNPTSGYISVNIFTNSLAKVQCSGTDPTKGEDSFSVENIKMYDADLIESASPLTNNLTDLNGDSYVGINSVQVWLWITIPPGTPIGTYTFTLSIVLVAL